MHPPRYKKALIIPVLVFIVLFSFKHRAQAQHRSLGMNADGNLLGGSRAGGGGGGYLPTEGWAVALNGGYEAPLGDLKDVYKAAPTFGLSVMRRWNHFIFSGTVDYRLYKPKQSSFSTAFDLGGGQTSTTSITYGDFLGIGLYAGASYEIPITYAAGFYLGANAGTIMSSYDFAIGQDDLYYIDRLKTNVTYIGPKLGLNFAVTNHLVLGVEARYSISLAKANYADASDNSVTKGFNSAAGNLFLVYSF